MLTFNSANTTHVDRIGHYVEVVRIINRTPDLLPLYVIRFADGLEIEASPYELQQWDW